MGGVYQEEIYSINHEFDSVEEVVSAKEFLNNNQPVCTVVDWYGNELTITNFGDEDLAEHFYRSLINYVDSQ
ncbi:hypothetical protein NVP1161O_221 [Vibrio phage 1.161.O._10N.261.48.C5]|nr:hypothetical protein NVP1161O_221 [Vibrio phage 1.161.O._10N.261.48.C5]